MRTKGVVSIDFFPCIDNILGEKYFSCIESSSSLSVVADGDELIPTEVAGERCWAKLWLRVTCVLLELKLLDIMTGLLRVQLPLFS